MSRLLVHVEGQTEETFVNEVLAPHLVKQGFESVSARLVGNARLRDKRKGIKSWTSVQKEIVSHLKQDSGCYATLMVDFYGLPQAGQNAWPGRETSNGLAFGNKAKTVEQALLAEVHAAMGHGFNLARFIPYVVMHEFEGLLFSDPGMLAKGIGAPHLAASFHGIANQFASPEEINDSPQTAPSKRLAGLVRGYDKPFHGVLASLEIGLEKIRQECPFFSEWVQKLESITS